MNILLVGEGQDVHHVVQLLKRSRHRLERRSLESCSEPDLRNCDMVLVDGNVYGCAQQASLLQWIREARRRHPHLRFTVMNDVGPHAAPGDWQEEDEMPRTCGIFESGDGVLSMRCRLQEIALGETAALMRDGCERASLEPVTFEYSSSRWDAAGAAKKQG